MLAKLADFRDFCHIFRRTLFVSVLCFAFGFMSAWAAEYPKITYYNQYSERIDDLVPDEYTEAGLSRAELPNSEAVSAATGCTLEGDEWYWDDKMSESVESIEPEPFEDRVLYGTLICDENRIVTLNPAGKEGIGSEGTRTLYYYRNSGESGEFFYNEYNGSKSASGVASSIVLPTYDDESYTFLGYYSDPDDMETQCVDERGYITEYGFQQMAEGGEGETSWDAVYSPRVVPMNTIQLLPMYETGAATSPGTGYIYGKPSMYGGGVYDAISGGSIISSITIPTWSGRSFLGYYSSSSANSTQYINSTGSITPAGIVKAQENPGGSNQTWYGHWSGTYILHYDCSTNYNVASQQGYGTAPADETHSSGQSVTLQQNQGCYPTDSYYSFGGWNCFNRVLNYYSGGQFTSTDYNSGPINNGYNLTMPYNNVWCEPIWIPDNATLTYTCGQIPGTTTNVSGNAPSSVPLTSGSVVLATSAPACTGILNHHFVGWSCSGADLSIHDSVYNGGDEIFSHYDVTCDAVWAPDNPCEPGQFTGEYEILGGLVNDTQWNSLQAYYPDYNVSITGMCSNTLGNYVGQVGNPTQSGTSADTYCWCQANEVTVNSNGETISLGSYPWVYSGSNNQSCTEPYCEGFCDDMLHNKTPSEYLFDNSLLKNPVCVYTINYNCDNLGATGYSSIAQTYSETHTGGEQNVSLYGNCVVPLGYTFGGWSCQTASAPVSPVGVNNDVIASMPYDNVNCTAQWTQPSYTVTYNCDNGNAQQSSMLGGTYNYGATVTLWTQNGNSVGSCDVPSNRVFVGWNCYFDNPDAYPPQATYDTTGYYQTVLYLSDYTESGTAISVDNVICDAQWACDTANGYTWDNYYQTCTNEYMIYYNPGNHGQYISGYNWASSGFGPGASNGGGTFGQYWSTKTLTGGHVEPADACYEFCGWSTVWNDTCGSANILTAGAQQPNVWDLTTYLNLYAVWQCASGCMASGGQCVPAPTAYTVTYHGGSCNASAQDFSNTVNAGSNHTVENPECASNNSNDWLPTDGCRKFIGWSTQDPSQLQNQNPTINYGNCDDSCSNQTGSCGTISNISSNIDLYAICDVMAHNVIYHDCDGDEVYTHSNAVSLPDGAQSANYTPLSPSVSQLSSSITPLSSFQGWATSETAGDDESWCGLESGDLYPELYGGNSDNAYYKYTKTGKICTDVDLYAVCCPLNLSWGLNGGGWPAGSSGNQTTCEYGASAGSAGSIGYGQTPLQTPLRTGYTFTGWKVTDYSTP